MHNAIKVEVIFQRDLNFLMNELLELLRIRAALYAGKKL